MKRSISTLITTLLFSAAIVPNAMAQIQQTNSPIDSSNGSAAVSEQSVPNSIEPTSTNSQVLPEPSKRQMSNVTTSNSDRTRPNVDRPSVNDSYPAYCPMLPLGTKPGDWEYREALEKCLYGT
jgi:hypothetical protein